MAEAYIGEIRILPTQMGAPDGWFFCQGQTLRIMDYQALYAVIGIQFGGDGVNNFQLPNLQGQFVIGAGRSQTSTKYYQQGVKGGAETVTLAVTNMPSHTHVATLTGGSGSTSVTVQASATAGTTPSPSGNYIANALFPQTSDNTYGPTTCNAYVDPAHAGTLANIAGASGSAKFVGGAVTNANTGGGLPASIMPPYVPINYIIAYMGYFPVPDNASSPKATKKTAGKTAIKKVAGKVAKKVAKTTRKASSKVKKAVKKG
jgi:microcystin-dependent protein